MLGGPAPSAAAGPWRQLLHLPFSLSALVWPEDDRECDTARASEPLPVGRPRRLPPPGQGSATAVTRAFFPGLFDDQKGETKQECLTSECHGWVCGSVQPAGSERPRPNQLQIKQGFERVFGPRVLTTSPRSTGVCRPEGAGMGPTRQARLRGASLPWQPPPPPECPGVGPSEALHGRPPLGIELAVGLQVQPTAAGPGMHGFTPPRSRGAG